MGLGLPNKKWSFSLINVSERSGRDDFWSPSCSSLFENPATTRPRRAHLISFIQRQHVLHQLLHLFRSENMAALHTFFLELQLPSSITLEVDNAENHKRPVAPQRPSIKRSLSSRWEDECRSSTMPKLPRRSQVLPLLTQETVDVVDITNSIPSQQDERQPLVVSCEQTTRQLPLISTAIKLLAGLRSSNGCTGTLSALLGNFLRKHIFPWFALIEVALLVGR